MLQIRSITFGYTETKIIENLTLNLEKGKTIAVIGESGCGKSTLLKLIYGLYDLDQGEIYWNDTEVTGPKFNLVPGMPFMKYLSQDFDLMPYTTVAENVGKYLSNFYPDEKKERITELLEVVEMTEYKDVKAKYLSGGQQQRVALARVLALEPEVLLLDEPFSHIDNFRKNALRRNLFSYLKAQGITVLMATHDSVDSLSFSDETVVLKNGKITDYGNSSDIYNFPKSKYTASLFGEVNEILMSQLVEGTGEDKILFLYPHQLKAVENGFMKVIVKHSYFKGSHYLIKAALGGKAIFFEHDTALEHNKEVTLLLA